MYDNVTETLYVITKVYYNVCSVYSLPMSLEYDGIQTLTKVCDLGVREDLGTDGKHGFHLVTGADISPDGSRILIKNHNNNISSLSVTLIWEREDNEDISETLKRQPLEIDAYKEEWQGEAICWLDSMIFYTTSDDDGEPPIYKYTSKNYTALEDVKGDEVSRSTLICHNGTLYIRKDDRLYTMTGEEVRF